MLLQSFLYLSGSLRIAKKCFLNFFDQICGVVVVAVIGAIRRQTTKNKAAAADRPNCFISFPIFTVIIIFFSSDFLHIFHFGVF